MKFFTSDWHLGHKRVVHDFGQRPFSSVEEMDNTIIENMFSGRKKGDMIFFLGDLYWNRDSFLKMYNKIPKGVRFYWIIGNHDNKQVAQHRGHFELITPMMETKVQGNHIVLCHYQMTAWNRSHHNSWQLYGHYHKGGHTEGTPVGKQLNVNLEYHNYKPWTEEELIEHMNRRPDNFDYIPRTGN